MYNDVIVLLTIVKTTSDIGDIVETETRKEVFAKVKSIGMKETYESMAVGLKPEYTFVLADYYDYDDEQDVEYGGIKYKVLRTYKKDTNELEIVVTR